MSTSSFIHIPSSDKIREISAKVPAGNNLSEKKIASEFDQLTILDRPHEGTFFLSASLARIIKIKNTSDTCVATFAKDKLYYATKSNAEEQHLELVSGKRIEVLQMLSNILANEEAVSKQALTNLWKEVRNRTIEQNKRYRPTRTIPSQRDLSKAWLKIFQEQQDAPTLEWISEQETSRAAQIILDQATFTQKDIGYKNSKTFFSELLFINDYRTLVEDIIVWKREPAKAHLKEVWGLIAKGAWEEVIISDKKKNRGSHAEIAIIQDVCGQSNNLNVFENVFAAWNGKNIPLVSSLWPCHICWTVNRECNIEFNSREKLIVINSGTLYSGSSYQPLAFESSKISDETIIANLRRVKLAVDESLDKTEVVQASHWNECQSIEAYHHYLLN